VPVSLSDQPESARPATPCASLTAGALVLAAIGIALIIISKNDRVERI